MTPEGSAVDMAAVGMAKKPISKIQHLSSRIESHLHQFAPSYDDPTEEEDMAAARAKKRNPYLRAGLAGGAVAGGVAIAGNKDKLKAGYQSAKAGVDSGIATARKAVKPAKKALFRGMQGVAGGAESGMRVAEKAGMKKAGGLLGRAAKYVSGKSMRLFNAELAATLVRLERKVARHESRVMSHG